MKYTAINIGPIVETILMARKPRELWSASFLFSYLMQCIIKAVPKANKIVSPGDIPSGKFGVGLCPDRIFIEGEPDTNTIRENALKEFKEGTELSENAINKYFKIMVASIEAGNAQNAIKSLNAVLDKIELFESTKDEKIVSEITRLVRPRKDSKYYNNSPLYELAFEDKKLKIETLGEIAAVQLKENSNWNQFVEDLKSEDKKISENAFDQLPKDKVKSYHKYICVVQADGDNMGKIVSNSNNVKEISNKLIEFGKNSTETIRAFGGMPIYAGGDDLLFIAPVIGKDNTNIFDLVAQLDEHYKKVQEKANVGDTKTSMSYGISISYYKYPLYESLSEARTLLFEKAKNAYKNKNAIAWNLHKHAGSSFYGVVEKGTPLFDAFENVIKASSESESLVAAVSHKIRANEGLINLWLSSNNYEDRNKAFFKKFIEYTGEEEKYKTSVLNLLNKVCEEELQKEPEEKEVELNWAKKIYGMIRTAKYINGEEVIE